MTPENVSLDYVELDAAKLKIDTSADDAALKERYEKQKARFVTDEQRLASHILVKVDKNAGPDEQKRRWRRPKASRSEAKSGKDFAALAKSDSDDSVRRARAAISAGSKRASPTRRSKARCSR